VQERESKRQANEDAAGWPQDDFSADLGHGNDRIDHGDATEETRLLGHHEAVPPALEGLDRSDRDAVVVLVEGTTLRQGSTYVDLDDLDAGPFRALANQTAEPGRRLVPKHRVDHELWNRLVGQSSEATTVRPGGARNA
jgi:hypothetical protein